MKNNKWDKWIYWGGGVLCAVLLSFCSIVYSMTLTNDDGYMFIRFNDIERKYGFWKSCKIFFLNLDLAGTGEFRTYGLSKLIHFLLHHIVGEKAYMYQFIITISHLCSGILIFKILKTLKIDEITAVAAGLIFVFNPFVHIQTFHHFTYLMLPLYFSLGYILFNLKTYEKNNKYTHIWNVILIFCTVFTGEYTLALLGSVILFFIIYSIKKQRKQLCAKYVLHLVLEGMLLLSWMFVWKNIISPEGVGRYQMASRFSFETMSLLVHGIVFNLKRFLWIGSYKPDFSPGDSTFSLTLFILSFLCIVAIMSGMVWCSWKKSREKKKTPIFLAMLIGCICLSSVSVYCMMNIVYGTGLATHYLYSVFSLFLVAIIVGLSCCKRRIFLAGSGALLLTGLCYNVFWYSYMIPTAGEIEKEMVEKIDELSQKKDTIIIETQDSAILAPVLLVQKCYSPLSCFSTGWSSGYYLEERFENVVLITQDTVMEDKGESLIFTGLKPESITLNGELKDTVSVKKSTSGIIYVNNGKRYYDKGIKKYKGKRALSIFSTLGNEVERKEIFIPPVILIDVGGKIDIDGIKKDKEYEECPEENIFYGYIGNTSVSGLVDDTESEYFSSNRYSINGEPFSYKFGNLQRDEEYLLVVDLLEYWHYNQGERVFDIEVETDDDKFLVNDLDPYYLSGAQNNQAASPIRVFIKLPETKTVTATFVSKRGYDVATIQGIGLIKK